MRLFILRVTEQHSMDKSDWNSNIVNMWIKHKGLDKEEAMLEYLKLVQNLEMYGVTYFEIKNKKGTETLLGVTSLGLNIYKVEDKYVQQLNQKLLFSFFLFILFFITLSFHFASGSFPCFSVSNFSLPYRPLSFRTSKCSLIFFCCLLSHYIILPMI